jgi:DNA-binding MarR family transcriptional regulator
MRKSVPARQQTGRVGELLFVAQQAAQALAIERLEPLGLSPRAWGVLSTLAESGPLTQIELATTMSIDRTAMVYLLDELEDQALVKRVRSPQDRRAFLIHLTAGGQAAQRRAATALTGAADTLLTPLDAAERHHLVDLLEKSQPTGNRSAPASSIPAPARPDRCPAVARHQGASATPPAHPSPGPPPQTTTKHGCDSTTPPRHIRS